MPDGALPPDAAPPDAVPPDAAAPLRLEAFLPYRLSVAAETVSHLFARRYEARFGLTIPEWRVMAVLGDAVAASSTQEVIARTRMDRVKVSRAVIRLADKGLVRRQPLPGDQRAHRLGLTRSGRALYRQIVPLAHDLQAALAGMLTPEEAAQIDRLLADLTERAAALLDQADAGGG